MFAHFDPDGQVASHVRRTVELLDDVTDRLVVVSSAPLTPDAHAWFDAHAQLVARSNTGHDFASYRAGLGRLGDSDGGILLVNDSIVPLVDDLRPLLAGMAARGADFWGLTPGYGFAPHLQSYFLAFTASVSSSPGWRTFWNGAGDAVSREDAILRGEVGLSRALLGAGLSMDSWFQPNAVERLRGAARATSGDLARALAEHRIRGVLGWLRRLPGRARTPEWNLAVALADIALRNPARLPIVKVSALRDDAYGLGSARLLAALEARYPHRLTGVRDYLERTDSAYGDRWARASRQTTGIVRYRGR